MLDKETVAKILAVTLVIVFVFVGLSAYLPTADQSNAVIALLTSFFGFGQVMIAVAFLRNIVGFLVEYARSKYTEQFEDQKLYETMAYYIGLVTLIGSIIPQLLPEPYGKIIAGIGVLILTVADIARQALKKLWGK